MCEELTCFQCVCAYPTIIDHPNTATCLKHGPAILRECIDRKDPWVSIGSSAKQTYWRIKQKPHTDHERFLMLFARFSRLKPEIIHRCV